MPQKEVLGNATYLEPAATSLEEGKCRSRQLGRNIMNSNQTVLEALAKEGVVMTEEALLREVKDGQTIPTLKTSARGMPPLDDLVIIARPALANGYSNGSLPVGLGTPGETNGTIALATKTEHPVPDGGGADEKPAYGIEGTRRGIRALAGRAMCSLGIHPAPWEYLRKGECNQLRDCQRCATAKMRVKHRRSWLYAGPKTCNQTKVCQRCGHSQGVRTKHEAWSESWSIGSNRDAHRCMRCGEVQSWSTDCGD